MARKRLGIASDLKVFLFVGRLHEQKGLDLLMDAFILHKKNGAEGILKFRRWWGQGVIAGAGQQCWDWV